MVGFVYWVIYRREFKEQPPPGVEAPK
jgi:hypothetical protein